MSTVTADSIIKEWDKSQHTFVMGPTGCGKSRILKHMMQQLLEAYQNGEKLGITLIEPKGDLTQDIVSWCKEYQIPHTYIDFENLNSMRFNPLLGDGNEVAQAITAGLKILFRKQDPFFVQRQLTIVKNIILLLKELHGDNLNFLDIVEMLHDESFLQKKVEELDKLQGETEIIQFFNHQILGSLWNQNQQLTLGLLRHLGNMASNQYVREILGSSSDIHLDHHLAEGGVLIVNSGIWKLGDYGDVLGASLLTHLQNAVFRRPVDTLIPHYLFADELTHYVTQDIDMLLALGRTYKCSCILSFQSFFHLEKEIRDTVLNNCRNRFVFSGLSNMDMEHLEPIAANLLSADNSLVYWGKGKTVTYANK